MGKILLVSIILMSATQVFSKAGDAGDCESCKRKLGGSPNSGSLGEIVKIAEFSELRKRQLLSLAESICYTYMQGALGKYIPINK